MSDPIAASKPEEIVESTDYDVLNDLESKQKNPHLSLTPKTKKTLSCFIAALCLLLPISLGGVHESIYYPIYCLSFLLAAYIIFSSIQVSSFKLGPSSTVLLLGSVFFIAWSFLQQLIFRLQLEPHSILNTIEKHGGSSSFLNPMLTMVFFTACIILSLSLLNSKKASVRWLSSILIHSGFIVSLIALSHWFYDNGRLFWFIEPDNVFTSTRARWPFVNSNHLGHFLLIPIFVCISSVRQILSSHKKTEEGENKPSRMKKISRLGTSRGQAKLIKLLYVFLALLSMVLALFGSLSRGALFGFSVGVLVLSISSIFTREKGQLLIKTPAADELTDDRRRRRRRGPDAAEVIEKYLNKAVKALPFIVAISGVALFMFFLSGEGAERLEGRLEYSLLHSKDNIRWEMYQDSFQIIKDYPLGIGLGNWSNVYPQYASERLAGLNPVYLHSDLLQLGVELGAPSILAMLALAIIFLLGIGKRCLLHSKRFLEKSSFSGILALLIASLLDFPFRITAVLFVFALTLSLLSYLDDKSIEESHN